MKLYIEFTRPKSELKIISGIIRLIQRTPYSHVRLKWVNSAGLNIVYEASGSEVKFLGEIAQKKHEVIIKKSYELTLTPDQYSGLLNLCMKYSGVSYGSIQMVGMGISQIFDLKSNPFSDGANAQVCSELVGRFLEEVMYIKSTKDFDLVGPKEIDALLAKNINNYTIKNIT